MIAEFLGWLGSACLACFLASAVLLITASGILIYAQFGRLRAAIRRRAQLEAMLEHVNSPRPVFRSGVSSRPFAYLQNTRPMRRVN